MRLGQKAYSPMGGWGHIEAFEGEFVLVYFPYLFYTLTFERKTGKLCECFYEAGDTPVQVTSLQPMLFTKKTTDNQYVLCEK